MIPGTIEEWKKALKESKPGLGRLACVAALMEMGQTLEGKHGDKWVPLSLIGGHDEYRVKPTQRPWNEEDAKRHIGFAWRDPGDAYACLILPGYTETPWCCREFAFPIPGTDPATWDWKKCEVVE